MNDSGTVRGERAIHTQTIERLWSIFHKYILELQFVTIKGKTLTFSARRLMPIWWTAVLALGLCLALIGDSLAQSKWPSPPYRNPADRSPCDARFASGWSLPMLRQEIQGGAAARHAKRLALWAELARPRHLSALHPRHRLRAPGYSPVRSPRSRHQRGRARQHPRRGKGCLCQGDRGD